MKTLIFLSLLLSGCMVTDYAHQTKTKAEKKADVRECHELTGSNGALNPSDEFKKCMVEKGYMPYEYLP